MSLLGIGSAKIDLKLDQITFQPGERATGHFFITGGVIEQQLKRIECDLVLTDKDNEVEEVIHTTTILTTKMIESEEINRVNFNFDLPRNIQASSKNINYRFKTKMIFKEGIKSEDQDEIIILHNNVV